MGGAGADAEGRAKCAWAFADHTFFCNSLTKSEYLSIVAKYIPPDYSARHPANTEIINEFSPDELAIPIAHFDAGLRLPMWSEVRQGIRQVLKYFVVIPGQITPNAISVVVAYACYLREEEIDFSLPVFRKLFSFPAYRDGTNYFASQHSKVRETVNKSHYWTQKFVLVKRPFGNIPFSPLQRDEATYRPPTLGGDDAKLFQFYARR